MTMIDLEPVSTMINANPNWEEFYKGLPVETLELDDDYLDEETGDTLQLDEDPDYIIF